MVSRPSPPPHDAALLAGGLGTRLGGGKPFVPLGDRPLAAWAAAAVSRHARRLVVVARTIADAEAVAAAIAPYVAVTIVPAVDRREVEGPVAGLLGAADVSEGVLLAAPADAPFLPDDLALRLGSAWPRPAIAAGERPHPTILLADAGRLRTLFAAASLRATLAPLDPARIRFDEAELLNVNTPADLAAAAARLGLR